MDPAQKESTPAETLIRESRSKMGYYSQVGIVMTKDFHDKLQEKLTLMYLTDLSQVAVIKNSLSRAEKYEHKNGDVLYYFDWCKWGYEDEELVELIKSLDEEDNFRMCIIGEERDHLEEEG